MAKLIAHSSHDGEVGPATRAWLRGEKVLTYHWWSSSKERAWVDFIGRDFVLCVFIVLGVLALVAYLR